MKIANFVLQHELSPEQISAGLYNPELTVEEQDKLKKLMLVDPNADSVYSQASELFSFIRKILIRENVKDFHIRGQANLMICLFRINSLYDLYNYEMWESTTERVSQEVVNTDGSTTNVFIKLRKYGC